jgi:hypothetical protein
MNSLNKRITDLEQIIVSLTPKPTPQPVSNASANGAAKILVNLSVKHVEDRLTEILNDFIVNIGPKLKTIFEIVKAAVSFVEEIAPLVGQLLVIAPGIFTGQVKLNTALFLIQEVGAAFYNQIGELHIIDMIEGILGMEKKTAARTKSTTSDVKPVEILESPEKKKTKSLFKSR